MNYSNLNSLNIRRLYIKVKDSAKFKLKTFFIEESVSEYNRPQFWSEYRFR